MTLFISYEAGRDERPAGFSLARVADGSAYDFKAGRFAPSVSPADAIRPLTWLTAAVHDGQAVAVVDVPPAEPFTLAIYFHGESGKVMDSPGVVGLDPPGAAAFVNKQQGGGK